MVTFVFLLGWIIGVVTGLSYGLRDKTKKMDKWENEKIRKGVR